MKVSVCSHPDFQIDRVKDRVGQNLALCKCKACKVEFIVLLDANDMPAKIYHIEPAGPPEKTEWVQ
jgi:hypothetical protein